jgi:hypothetical protein
MVFRLSGFGQFSVPKLGGLINPSGTFQVAVLLEYQVLLDGNYFYVLPAAEPQITPPQLTSLNASASFFEWFIGAISSNIVQGFREKLVRATTVIPFLQGRVCVVDGWIRPGAIPTRCEGDTPYNAFFPNGFTEEALPWPPPGWNPGMSVTDALRMH